MFVCILSLLMLALPTFAFAEDEAAEDLTRRTDIDAGELRFAETRMSDPELDYYQIFDPGMSFSLSWGDDVPAARLCLQWRTLPEGVSVRQFDANGNRLSEETLPGDPETVTRLTADTRRVEIVAGEAGMKVSYCRVYGEGTLPEPFHEWAETPEKLDFLLISTHPDDDVLYLGSVMPVYGAERGYVGTIAYVTCRTRGRMTEAENGAWTMGLRTHPLFLGFPDVPRDAPKEEKDTFVYDEVLLATVRLYRRYRPCVVFAQDRKGEYGHWQHKLTSKASVEAAPLAADPAYDPESAEQYGTWQVQKVFLHLYGENQILIDAHAPLSFFGGDDAFTVAKKAFKKHKSQQGFGFAVRRDNKQYAFNRFGMAYGVVEVGEDVFDNIDETLFASYVPPTPEPTEAPTATPEPTEAPTATPEPTAVPTATPEPTPEPEPQTPQKNGRGWILCIVIAAALIALAGFGLRHKQKKKEIDRGKETNP